MKRKTSPRTYQEFGRRVAIFYELSDMLKYGGPEVCDELLIEMAAWLKGQGHPVPDHYRLQQFTPQEQWMEQSFPN